MFKSHQSFNEKNEKKKKIEMREFIKKAKNH